MACTDCPRQQLAGRHPPAYCTDGGSMESFHRRRHPGGNRRRPHQLAAYPMRRSGRRPLIRGFGHYLLITVMHFDRALS